jgi:hypothetical protein
MDAMQDLQKQMSTMWGLVNKLESEKRELEADKHKLNEEHERVNRARSNEVFALIRKLNERANLKDAEIARLNGELQAAQNLSQLQTKLATDLEKMCNDLREAVRRRRQ